ncbi:unnamed protein product [Miscanthus lutarioriparius]|uniref:Threonylcarbamoyl-AMP synthase n=1 Tax=Miscanthus lutarioriparius TaxID=422564 RepID=A0A811MBH7_9POAL|nr:unnamed protein product [Miscanthus lutarioriparius]
MAGAEQREGGMRRPAGLGINRRRHSAAEVRVSENTAHRIDATAENIFPAMKDHVLKASDAINRGEVIAVPTDTIYSSAGAVNRIYEIKGRIQTRPLTICVADVSDISRANLSGQPSSVSVKDFEGLWPHCSYVFDGGVLPSGRAGSTIVDLITPGVYKILRDGSSRKETAAVLGKFGFVEAL